VEPHNTGAPSEPAVRRRCQRSAAVVRTPTRAPRAGRGRRPCARRAGRPRDAARCGDGHPLTQCRARM
jgi:hypothetical protein